MERCGKTEEEVIAEIRALIRDHSQAHRRKLSQLLCQAWNWRNARGEFKDMAARNLMLKLHGSGQITLPPPRRPATNGARGLGLGAPPVPGPRREGDLRSVQPIRLEKIEPTSGHRRFFGALLAHYHYLGWRKATGENLQYLAWSAAGEPLACLVFEAAAWKVAARDQYLRWDGPTRQKHLRAVTNNSRFMVLPWIEICHLASHLLGRIAGRLRRDWIEKYGHPVELVETFVESQRFEATCYRAANWIYLGQTQGRSRKDRNRTLQVPVKAVYVCPLSRDFRQRLGGPHA
jgi:hypothetical protein